MVGRSETSRGLFELSCGCLEFAAKPGDRSEPGIDQEVERPGVAKTPADRLQQSEHPARIGPHDVGLHHFEQVEYSVDIVGLQLGACEL
jgi:hypothetical protein